MVNINKILLAINKIYFININKININKILLEVTNAVSPKTISIKTIPITFNGTKITFKIENSYILLNFLLLDATDRIAVISYWCLIKHQSKQKHLLQYCDISDKLK